MPATSSNGVWDRAAWASCFKARHIFLKTSHAIKVILPDLVGNDPMLVTRFRQEALAAAAIRHQNIIAVTDFGVVRGTMPFLVMEFVKGKSLQDILADEGAMSPQRALGVHQRDCVRRRRGASAEHRASRSETAEHHGPGRCADRGRREDSRLRFGEDQVGRVAGFVCAGADQRA